MKNTKIIFIVFLCSFLFFSNISFANLNIISIDIGEEIIVDGQTITTETESEIYLTQSEDKYRILNLEKSGIYKITGNSENVQIVINKDKIKDDVKIELDNIYLNNINAPTIKVISKRENDNVKFETLEKTENFINSIESSSKITFDGKGNLKTTTIRSEKDIIIENGFIYADKGKDVSETSTIYSKGKIIINNGKVYVWAGEDDCKAFEAENGTYINGGTVLGIGSLECGLKTENDTRFLEMHTLTLIREKESIVISNHKKEILFSCKTDRDVKTVIYTSPEMQKETIGLYSGTDIKGEIDEYGVYKKVDKVNIPNLVKNEDREDPLNPGNLNPKKHTTEEAEVINRWVKIGIIIIGGVIFIIMTIVNVKSKKVNGFVNLFVGILIGALIGFGVSQLVFPKGIDVNRTEYDRKMEELLPELPENQGDMVPPEFQGGNPPQRPNGFNPNANK